MFVEILLMQKYRQYLANPLISNSIIIGSLLIFSGFASFYSDRIQKKRRTLLLIACGFLSLYFTTLIFFFESFFLRIAGTSKIWQLIMPALSTAPLGLAMGLFFPFGISIVKDRDISSLPWAWSVNGFFSVIASTGTVLIASNIGLLSTGGIALFCYWLALLSFPE
jgi:MFS family permease